MVADRLIDPKRLNMEELVSYLADSAGHWISSQRELHRAHARLLPDTTIASLRGFFSEETLNRVRILQVPVIKNPSFYKEFENAGEPIPLDFSVWSAITFGDVILVSDDQVPGPPPHSLVFHEMVHLVQYDELGIFEFARRYVIHFMQNRLNHLAIPLESLAFDLQVKFENWEAKPFFAEAEVRANIDKHGLPYSGHRDGAG